MESDWLDIEELPLYAAVKAGETLERLRASKIDSEVGGSAHLAATDRTASILTFRVRFEPATTSDPFTDSSSSVEELPFRKAN